MYLYLVVICYLNSAHDRTETSTDEAEAIRFYDDLQAERAGKDYVQTYLLTLNTDSGHVITNRQWQRQPGE